MINKNSQIRAKARYLLDDNIFGKDWMKAAFLHIFIDLFIVGVGALLFHLAIKLAHPLMALVQDKSVVLYNGIPILFVFIALLLTCAVIGPFNVGFATVYTDLARNGGVVRAGKFFSGFKCFVSNFVIGIMYTLQITLWTLFFIVPGVYMAYSYALAFHVKSDNPDFRWKQCFDESERLMEGNRWRLFKLQISHIGWFFVGLSFVGIGAYWAEPYLYTSTAVFYEEAKAARYQ